MYMPAFNLSLEAFTLSDSRDIYVYTGLEDFSYPNLAT
jgi:hypothetical protein